MVAFFSFQPLENNMLLFSSTRKETPSNVRNYNCPILPIWVGLIFGLFKKKERKKFRFVSVII